MVITIEKTTGENNRIVKMSYEVGYHTNKQELISIFENMLNSFNKERK